MSGIAGFIDDQFDSYFDSSADAYDVLQDIVNNPFLPPFLVPILCSALCGTFNNVSESESSDVSYELRLTSPADRSVRWSVGAYYYDGEQEGHASRQDSFG